MFKSIKVALSGLILCVYTNASADVERASVAKNAVAEQPIQWVIDSFKQAIVEKQSDDFLNLFHSDSVSWVGVISQQTVHMLVRKDPRFAQQPKIRNSSPQEFIQGIVNSEVNTREETDNIRIIADGDVASVMFDYRLYKNDKLNNWGQENWQLINTADGWKINAVNFSYTMNPELFSAAQ